MRVQVGDHNIFCHTGGVPFDSELPTVMLIHGAGMDHSVWRFQARALAHSGLAVLAPDLPGHGRSDDPWGTSIEDMADVLKRLLEVVGADPGVAVVGHSMGSLIGIELAASEPEVVSRLVLVCTSGEMRVHPELQAAADAGETKAVDLMVGWVHTGNLHFGGLSEPGGWAPGLTDRLLRASLHRALASDLRACVAYPGLERARKVRTETLVIAGSRDRMTPASAGVAVADAIQGARLEVIEDGGHSLISEEPAAMLRLLSDFLTPVRS